ncbi:mitochondrial carrier [Coniochaeta ligniaria NRRL 30616]|uniref:Mitochondrial carrier n=1 Tax=Coniochaeta ligniaria NRRL 30616 TaxID=1408157 RepID=A0A1J7J4T5_9PEZI|nr:mitochondrial carrier [Coniochaeta ligniaria NRRL 30616]
MAHQREGVNPLRPYYIPPTIGDEPLPAPGPHAFAEGAATGKYTSKARDIFSDIDYKDYISDDSSSVVQTVKDLLDELLWKYTSVLMAQPFDVAKTILQVRSQDDSAALSVPTTPVVETRRTTSDHRSSIYDELPDSDSDPDEPAYFTSNAPSTPTPSYPRSQRRGQTSPLQSPRIASRPAAPAHQLLLRAPDSVLEVISQVWQKEGAWGVWKGSNATFIYTVLSSLLENWSRSLLSALFNVPDLGVKDDLDRLIDIASPYPWASLFVAAAAAVTTGLILSPLDLVRTRLILTPTNRSPRGTLSTLRKLPSYICPPALYLPTILHSLVHPLLTLSTPLILRTRFMINQELSPITFSIAKFCSSSVALFIKLPLETVLRRGQASVLGSPAYVRALETAGASSAAAKGKRLGGEALETIVPPGRFDGVFGTMQAIVSHEGTRAVSPSAKGAAANAKKGKPRISETVYRRGQGLEGLWRGWKVSWWGLVGLWTAGVLAGGGDGEF